MKMQDKCKKSGKRLFCLPLACVNALFYVFFLNFFPTMNQTSAAR